nr:immunoglobulin light chain junction region [Macaca mulatta]MPN65290.1 immunoglobulin light chain junction region [Macaca mulatta]MPN65311.1 immunoglobulin light chain junction region [Macaca mulatta]MPN65363.1 immunoglobulin light chain junction region [Macaca mulatta]MPN65369.1 immunoglobulin light chain junction region [Macaca mulatta]
CAIGHSSGDVF